MTRLASATAQDAIGDIDGRTASEGEPRMTASRSVAEFVVPDEGAATGRHTTPGGLDRLRQPLRAVARAGHPV